MLKKEKLVLMIASSIGGGAQILLLNLAPYLNAHFDLMIFCPPGYLSEQLIDAGFKPNICEINIKTIFGIRKKVLVWAQEEQFTVNPFLFGTAFYASLGFGKYPQCRIFSLFLNPIVREDLSVIKKIIYIKIARYIGKKSQGIGVGSPELREEVQMLTGIEPHYLENRVPNICDYRTRFYDNRGGEPLKVCFVGRMADQKRPDIFVETALITHRADINIRYFMAGEGHLKEKIDYYIKENNLTDCVSTIGFINDLYPFLKDMDVLACTSEFENTPLIILNAMNASLPVVAGNIPGIPHLIRNGIDGIITNEYSPKGFADALISLAKSPELLKSMSLEAYSQAVTVYSFDNFADAYMTVLHSKD